MEEEFFGKPYVTSEKFLESREQIYNWGIFRFGYFQAERYDRKIDKAIETLSTFYTAYPPCRHIPTKSRMYRNIILDAHLIIYRITDLRIEVLLALCAAHVDIVHSASSIRKIRNVRKIRI